MTVWLHDLADILRQANVPVKEMTYTRGPRAGKKWTQVGANNQGLTSFDFIVWHHDASPPGPSYGALEWMMYSEYSPAASVWVDLDGVWHIYCAGLAWHAGRGGPGWGVAQDMMNYHSLGIETDHTTGEPWPFEQLDSLRRGTAAIMAAYNIDPQPGLLFHKTWTDGGVDGVPTLPTLGRKNDPDGLDLAHEREVVQGLIDDASGVTRKVKRLERLRRGWQRRRDAAKAAGDVRALRRARTKLRDLAKRIKDLRR